MYAHDRFGTVFISAKFPTLFTGQIMVGDKERSFVRLYCQFILLVDYFEFKFDGVVVIVGSKEWGLYTPWRGMKDAVLSSFIMRLAGSLTDGVKFQGKCL